MEVFRAYVQEEALTEGGMFRGHLQLPLASVLLTDLARVDPFGVYLSKQQIVGTLRNLKCGSARSRAGFLARNSSSVNITTTRDIFTAMSKS